MADKWLESLQKVAPVAAPQSNRAGDSLVNVLLDKAFGRDDDVVVMEKAVSVYDDPAVTALDPVGDVIEKTRRDRLRVPEIAAPVEHPDGVEFERCADMVFKFHWQGGNLVKSETYHPNAGWESVEEPLRPIFVEDRIAKMIGAVPDVRDEGELGGIPTVNSPRHSYSYGPSVKPDLQAMTDSLDELLGSYASMPDDSKTKAFNVGGERLAKGQITSRMLAVLSKIRSFCIGSEEKEIEKAINCLDFTAFGELSEPVLERMRSAIESVRH